MRNSHGISVRFMRFAIAGYTQFVNYPEITSNYMIILPCIMASRIYMFFQDRCNYFQSSLGLVWDTDWATRFKVLGCNSNHL